MTREEVMTVLRDAFHDAPRPDLFIRGTCWCDECMEHNETLRAHTPDTITIEELGNPGWDPICFANDQAFVYYLPAMFRLAFEPGDYVEMLLFHLDTPGRLDALDDKQAAAVLEALWVLLEALGGAITGIFSESELVSVIEKLEQRLDRG